MPACQQPAAPSTHTPSSSARTHRAQFAHTELIDELMRICCLGPEIEEFKEHAFPIMCAWMDDSKNGRYLGKLDSFDDNVDYFKLNIND